MPRKTAVPTSANPEATSIFSSNVAPGANSVTISRPSEANSTVPAVDGSTNRLRESICMSRPATLIDIPERMIASVRGTLLTISSIASCCCSPASNRSSGPRSPTPTNRLTTARTRTPKPASKRAGPCRGARRAAICVARDSDGESRVSVKSRSDFRDHLGHGVQPTVDDVPTRRVQIHHLVLLPCRRVVHEFVVEYFPGSGAVLLVDCGVPVDHEQPVGVLLADVLERHGFAVGVRIDVLVGRLHPEDIVNHPEPRPRPVCTDLAPRGQHGQGRTRVGGVRSGLRDRLVEVAQFVVDLVRFIEDTAERAGLFLETAQEL